jgi:[acyl-carrier-protein] S-malonyltransferase
VDADAFAGHSLGELSALTAAGVWSDEQGLRLVVLRAELMAAAASGTEGGMLALLKGDLDVAGELAKRLGVTVANDNSIGQVVLSGPTAALSEVAQLARERGLRAIALDVSGAFHSPAMRAAVEPFREQLHRVVQRPPSAPVYSALTAEPFVDVAGQLSAAVCAPVRWRETMLSLDRAGLERYIDVGPDVVLARLSARNLPGREALGAEELGVPA